MHRIAVAILAIAVAAAALAAQDQTPPPPPPIQIHRAEGAIAVDGNLDDPGWKNAAVIDRTFETSPGNNTPAKVRTIVHLTYDDRYFYIGVRCEDPNPGQIRAPFVDRDNVIGTDDNIAVFLDTRGDKRSALELRVNPRGIQGDGIFNDANGNEDFSPDFFYDTAAKIDSGGWSAEYRIPFSSLRYNDAPVQKWNILVWRNYPREYRYAFHTAPIPRSANCLICFLQPIEGLEGLPKSGHLVAAPYVTAQQTALPEGDLGTPLHNEPLKKDAGLDVKWTPSANQAIDMTFNPDFSQVEADVAQITTNQRFALLYPEKRPFFLEGFDLFDTPVQVAYTRTITQPRWGARSTGRLGEKTAYTVLITDDRGGGLTILPGPLGSDVAPLDFKSLATIARVRHDLGRSFVGAVFTDREYRGGGHNRVIGPDFQWRPSDSDAITGELLYSSTTNPDRPDVSPVWNGERTSSHAFYAGWNHVKEKYQWFTEARDYGNHFRADLGFVPQVGFREYDAGADLKFYPQGLLRLIQTGLRADYQRDQEDRTILRSVFPQFFAVGAKNLTILATIRPKEQIFVGDRLLDQTYGTWLVQFDPSRRWPRITLQGRLGQSIDFGGGRVGRGSNYTLASTIRPLDKITFDVNASREWLDAQGQRVYTATIERLKTTYSFSANSLLRVIGQYVDTKEPVGHSGSFLGSVLYSYKLNWQTVLFAGYGDDRVLNPNADLLRADRTFFFKVSYAIQK